MKDLLAKVKTINGYENLREYLGDELGQALYDVVNAAGEECADMSVIDPFAQGVVYACARLCDAFDQPSMALSILKESGISVAKAVEYDVAVLRKEDPTLPKGID